MGWRTLSRAHQTRFARGLTNLGLNNVTLHPTRNEVRVPKDSNLDVLNRLGATKLPAAWRQERYLQGDEPFTELFNPLVWHDPVLRRHLVGGGAGRVRSVDAERLRVIVDDDAKFFRLSLAMSPASALSRRPAKPKVFSLTPGLARKLGLK